MKNDELFQKDDKDITDLEQLETKKTIETKRLETIEFLLEEIKENEKLKVESMDIEKRETNIDKRTITDNDSENVSSSKKRR